MWCHTDWSPLAWVISILRIYTWLLHQTGHSMDLETYKISLHKKHNLCDLSKLIKHSLVLVIIYLTTPNHLIIHVSKLHYLTCLTQTLDLSTFSFSPMLTCMSRRPKYTVTLVSERTTGRTDSYIWDFSWRWRASLEAVDRSKLERQKHIFNW